MKYNIILTLSFIFIVNFVFAQYFNNIYNYEDSREFESETHFLKNDNLIEIGSGRLDNAKRGIIIRKLNDKVMHSGRLANNQTIATAAWTNGLYILNLLKDDGLLYNESY